MQAPVFFGYRLEVEIDWDLAIVPLVVAFDARWERRAYMVTQTRGVGKTDLWGDFPSF